MEEITAGIALKYAAYFGTYSVVLGQTLPWVIEFWNRTFKPKTSKWKSRWSWIIPIVLHILAWFIAQLVKVGFLYEVHWVSALFFGAWAATISNVNWNNVPWLKDLINDNLDKIIGFINDLFNTTYDKATKKSKK
jgi:hypothetical protein